MTRFTFILAFIGTFVSAQALAEPLTGKIGSKSGSDWQSSWMDLRPVRRFTHGDRLKIAVNGTAEWVAVRLLPENVPPNSSAGLVTKRMRVPPGGVLNIVLQSDHSAVAQVSVHGGREAWGEALNANGGEVHISRIDLN